MKKMTLIITLLFISLFTFGKDNPRLCTAIRGNGELVFAHWSSLAKIVEHYGPIDKLAGGSSAAITIFLYESISKNPFLSCHNSHQSCMKRKSLEISLLLKSLQGYFDYWITTKEIENVGLLYGEAPVLLERLKFWSESAEDDLTHNLSTWDLYKSVKKHTKDLIGSKDLKKLINPELKKFLKRGLQELNAVPLYYLPTKIKAIKKLKFRLLEAIDSVKLVVAGGFDAKNDKRLFFRPGILSFEDIADKFGRIADFYSGYFYKSPSKFLPFLNRQNNHINEYEKRFKSFLNICASQAQGKSWSEFGYFDIKKNRLSSCGRMFKELVHHYRSQLILDQQNEVPRKHRVDDMVGDKTFPTTSVLSLAESKRFTKTYDNYWESSDFEFGVNWSIPYDSLKFGYWGNELDLKKAKFNLKNGVYKNLEKSKKMIKLKPATWKTVLSVSPAEPGLSRLKEIPGMNGVVSAGGWSDLHPTIFLKSLGCENVVYVTRVNGETVFGQGVVKRIFGLKEPSWSQIDPKGGELTRQRNNNGNINDTTSKWSKLYNIANPKSSFSQSVAAADAVWCTDWDTLDIKTGYTDVLDKAYNSNFYIKSQAPSTFFRTEQYQLNTIDTNLIERKDHNRNSKWPAFVGCIPL